MDLVHGADGHGPWCGCPDCARASTDFRVLRQRLELYRAQLERRDELIAQLQLQQMQPPPFSPNPDLYTPVREPRSPAFTLAIVGMLVALAVVSQILLWFH